MEDGLLTVVGDLVVVLDRLFRWKVVDSQHLCDLSEIHSYSSRRAYHCEESATASCGLVVVLILNDGDVLLRDRIDGCLATRQKVAEGYKTLQEVETS